MIRGAVTAGGLFLSVCVGLAVSCGCWAQDEPPFVLPPLPDNTSDPQTLSSQLMVVVKGFRFQGNTAFSNVELGEVLASYIGRTLSAEDLEQARQDLTLHYINHGYINSGAVLPDQVVQDGVLTFEIVEGALTEVSLQGHQWLRSGYLLDRLRLGAGHPLNRRTLMNQLELIRDNPNIERIHAVLKPGPIRGESQLDVEIEEANAFHMGLRLHNRHSPSIGAERFDLLLVHSNLTGNSDTVEINYGITKNGIDDIELSGKDNVDVRYTLPITAYDTTMTLRYIRSDALVVEEPFRALDINSQSRDYIIELRHPVHRTATSLFAMSIAGERRENETFIFGNDPFSFSQDAQSSETDVTVLTLGQELVIRDQDHVIAGRSVFRFGLNALDATTEGDVDGQFFTWQGRIQCVQRLGTTQNQAILRATTQLADGALLPLEKFALGGLATVRGYRENQMVRDNGVVLTAEVRLPLLFNTSGQGVLFVAPFVDLGIGWDDGQSIDSQNIASAGLGLLLNLDKHVNFQVYWGYPLRDFDDSEDDVQDLGLHFDLVWFIF